MTLPIETLKLERDALRQSLRDLEVEHRKAEAALKDVRQRELRAKREVEALTTLIELAEGQAAAPSEG